ncbi:putative ADP,ATP carrier protein 1, mitochondrial precursor, putative,ADP/ATP translocase 1 [Trypanosoma theileri]|uniref:ADP/ATP translocase n=1 Tax=Trypanosoma theileri TaxID=67003 RepID=A0A1X0NQ13_9TRYP|nr:putative ADP,ATP carrier protein 1, mitochondrial precursor, putative,ADP/ATP translocase 1 [Trypanosoma theileri]ORC86279.1 putative ADP,ATP carrier protein 1, mitochondrial precursor, putative,ADP/ATP translocase 1 [Trypanosoma theileri]
MEDTQFYGHAPSTGEVIVDGLASFLGSFIQWAMMAPAYRVTVLTAVEGELVREGRLPPTGFGGVYNCVKRIYKKEGIRSFFRGFLADVFLAAPSAVAEQITSSLVTEILALLPNEFLQTMPPMMYVTISLLSTSTAVLLASPVTGLHNTIVTNYIGDIIAPDGVEKDEKNEKVNGEDKEEDEEKKESYKYTSPTETAKDIRKRCGFGGFYRAFGLDSMAVFLYRGTYYYALHVLPTAVHERYPFAVARSLAIVAGFVTQPFEVVSRRMQLTASSKTHGYKNMVDCARTIVTEEGYTALWSGLRARLLVTCVGMAVVELRRLF